MEVLLAGIAVAGTLVGVWLGNWLQERRRHDDEKRRAYARFLGLIEQARAAVRRGIRVPDDYEPSLWEAVAVIDLIGSPAVHDAASDVSRGMWTWLSARADHNPAADEIDARLDEAVKRLTMLAKADLGIATKE